MHSIRPFAFAGTFYPLSRQSLKYEVKTLLDMVGSASCAATPDEVDAVLDILWGGAETLIIISSDLSHFLPYHVAQSVDQQTVQSILELQGTITHEQACGGTPINGFVMSAKRHHLRPQLLDYRNSGDTAGDKSRVVGYASFAFMEDGPPHTHRF